MTKSDPFGFDISAASDKKRRLKGKRGMSGASDTSTRACDHRGCEQAGQYRAPKSPDTLDDYFWFCREHAREYNLKWNFFQGTTDEEFEKFIDKDRVWGRETKPFGKLGSEDRAWQRLGIEDPMEVLGANATLAYLTSSKTFNTWDDVTSDTYTEVISATRGVILRSPSGTRYRVTVTDAGTLTVSAV